MLDVIGLAGTCYSVFVPGTLPLVHGNRANSQRLIPNDVGFGYHFNTLAGGNDELANAYHLIFTTARKLALRTILETWIPLLRIFASLLSFQYQFS